MLSLTEEEALITTKLDKLIEEKRKVAEAEREKKLAEAKAKDKATRELEINWLAQRVKSVG